MVYETSHSLRLPQCIAVAYETWAVPCLPSMDRPSVKYQAEKQAKMISQQVAMNHDHCFTI